MEELDQIMQRWNIQNKKGPYDPPIIVNRLFQTRIGHNSDETAYLRPENSQGQFLHFNTLLRKHQRGKMPFTTACVGKSFRNDITLVDEGPCARKEFMLADIEHFVDPDSEKNHDGFFEVEHLKIPVFTREMSKASDWNTKFITISELLHSGEIKNQIIGYFLGRVYLFLHRIGMNQDNYLRFNHTPESSMPFYGNDHWNVDVYSAHGWVKCGGITDRGIHDMKAHSEATGVPLVVREKLPQRSQKQEWTATVNTRVVGPRFRKDTKKIQNAVALLNQDELEQILNDMRANEKATVAVSEGMSDGSQLVTLTSEMCTISQTRPKGPSFREYTPEVIELSFSLHRLFHCLLTQAHCERLGKGTETVRHKP